MRRLGASANWTYADTEGQRAGYFTMDARMSRAVIEVFVRLYEEGLDLSRQAPGELGPGPRHRGVRPRGRHRGGGRQDLGDPSIPLRGWQRFASCVATTRPETMLGDVAVAVHPKDQRYAKLVGKQRAAAAHRTKHPGDRRRVRRPRIRHRRGQDHARRTTSTTTRSASATASSRSASSRSTRRSTSNGPRQVPRTGPLRRAQAGRRAT